MPVPTIQLTGSACFGVGPARPSAEVEAIVAGLPQYVCLGRIRPKAMPPALRLAAYLDEGAMSPPLPTSINRRDAAAKSIARMYLNDQLGDCVIAGKGHALGVWSANDSDSGGVVLATDAEIKQQYQAICGPGDNGCVITNVLDVMRSKGFQAGGKLYKIDGERLARLVKLSLD